MVVRAVAFFLFFFLPTYKNPRQAGCYWVGCKNNLYQCINHLLTQKLPIFPTNLPMYETYFLQNGSPRWNQILTQLRFIQRTFSFGSKNLIRAVPILDSIKMELGIQFCLQFFYKKSGPGSKSLTWLWVTQPKPAVNFQLTFWFIARF